jgi:hypothetical protein
MSYGWNVLNVATVMNVAVNIHQVDNYSIVFIHLNNTRKGHVGNSDGLIVYNKIICM